MKVSMQKQFFINDIMKRLGTNYQPDSPVTLRVKKALSKLSKSELDSLWTMILTACKWQKDQETPHSKELRFKLTTKKVIFE